MIADRYRREFALALGYASLYCAVSGAAEATAQHVSLIAIYYALTAVALLVIARRVSRSIW